jgi:type III pantothenate kinase
MNLLVEIGNSRLKWTTSTPPDIGLMRAIDYRQTDVIAELRTSWIPLAAPEKLAIASVGHKDLITAVLTLAKQLWPELIVITPKVLHQAFGVTNAYTEAELLGVDRWLAVIAAHHHYPGIKCIVDCGTAITLDVVNEQGLHLGGLICPGLSTMKKSLMTNTAALVFNTDTAELGLGVSTSAGIENGLLFAAAGMVVAFLKRFQQPTQLILTGGDAHSIATVLQQPVNIDAELLFKGLAIFCLPSDSL